MRLLISKFLNSYKSDSLRPRKVRTTFIDAFRLERQVGRQHNKRIIQKENIVSRETILPIIKPPRIRKMLDRKLK